MSSSPTSPTSPSENTITNIHPDDAPYSSDDPRLTPLEASILNEYHKLKLNLDELAQELRRLASNPSAEISDGLRILERKTALVCTALKSSVYGIVLQQQIEGESVGGDSRGEGEGSEVGRG